LSKNRNCVGEAVTLVYVAILICIVIVRWPEIQELKLNELGDALAGAFGPLAFVWLVLGYFQQGEELRQNTEALRLQAEELKASVKQQELLVKANEATLLAAERPILTVTATSPRGIGTFKGVTLFMLRFQFHNAGRTHAMRVRVLPRIVVAPTDEVLTNEWEKLCRDQAGEISREVFGIVVAPNSMREMDKTVVLQAEGTSRARQHAQEYYPAGSQKWPRICVLGYVAYESIMGSEHLTAFGFEVVNADQEDGKLPNSPSMRLLNVVLRDLPWIAAPTT
jgi:hypothetical protein